MDFSAPHAGFVVASYALSFILIGGLTVRILLRDRRARAEAERLERQRLKGEA